MQGMKKDVSPTQLTVQAQEEIVVPDAPGDQRLPDSLDECEARERVRQGQADVAAGRVKSLREFVKSFGNGVDWFK